MQVFLHASRIRPGRPDIDLAFLHVREHGPHLPQGDIRLMSETVVPVCSPALVRPASAMIRASSRATAGWRKSVDRSRTSWDTWSARLGLDPSDGREPLVLSGLSTVVAAAAGVGIALGRAPLVDEELASGGWCLDAAPEAGRILGWAWIRRTGRSRWS